ncbi:helix-turn-helix transcriptional regulator [Cryptosporangium arvum]|uniref:helix-turn-helix transcriptional regulator n=1 Tax=Cryptosporangium arvum TaxID=80871 RepID=UPI0007C4509A|nr:helix-turn-helix transcriptional regulator [Cryptosporangium arvum]
MLAQLHSALAEPAAGRCSSAVAAAAPWLRPYVVGYGGYRALGGPPVRRRMFPITLTTLLLDADEGARLVTGARRTGAVHDGRPWRSGVSVGLTPAGVRALLGAEAAAVAGATVVLDAGLGRLADRLAELPDWPSRVAALDTILTGRLRGRRVQRTVDRAWWRLQDPAGVRVGALAAELGVSRRYLELEFRRRIGLSPQTVARVARLQRAVGVLTAPAATLGDAAAVGFADQSHLSRETRALLGSTPGELFAFVQDAVRPAH